MDETSNRAGTKASSAWDEVEQQTDEYFESSGLAPIPVEALLQQIEELNRNKIPDEELDKSQELANGEGSTQQRTTKNGKNNLHAGAPEQEVSNAKVDELSLLLAEESKASTGGHRVCSPPVELSSRTKPLIKDSEPADTDDYEESFASQHETAQLREDFDNISMRYKALEEKFDIVLRERENLPTVLNSIRHDLNTQLTEFSDKLYKVLESQRNSQAIQDTLATVEEVRAEHADQLRTASSFLSADPRASSPLVTKGASLKGKGRFKPIK